MSTPKPIHQRRLVEREYNETEIRKAFGIPDDECINLSQMFKYDPNRGTIVMTTLKDFDAKKGDS